jgi:hypothetical protein
MKRISLVLLCASLTASAADPGGIWTLAYATENGLKRESKLDLKVDGGSVSGVVSSERGKAPIANGRINGADITFDLIRDARYDLITVHFKGRLEGDTMKLTMQYGARDPVAVIGKKGS